MGSEIYKEPVLANFRVRKGKQPDKPSRQETRPGNNEAHLTLIRLMPCCVCLETRPRTIVDPHHLQSGEAAKERGVGMRATDKWAVPLCRIHHDMLHRLGSRKERGFFFDGGIDPYDLAVALWVSTGDLERMCNILITQRELFARID